MAHWTIVNKKDTIFKYMLRVSLNAEETDTVFLHYFFIRRQAEGGKKH